MANRIEDEIPGNIQITDAESFYSTLLTLDRDIIDRTTARFTHDRGLTSLEMFPWDETDDTQTHLEADMYAPFSLLANTILRCAVREGHHVHSHWISRANHYPRSLDEDSSLFRPDGCCALGDQTGYCAALDILESLESDDESGGPSSLEQAQVLATIVARYADVRVRYYQPDSGQETPKAHPLEEQVQKLRKCIEDLTIAYPETEYMADGVLQEDLKKRLNLVLNEATETLKFIDGPPKGKSQEPVDQLLERTHQAIRFMYRSLPVFKYCKASRKKLRTMKSSCGLNQVKKLEKTATLWWLRVVAPLEMKPVRDAHSVRVGSAQLLRCMRLVLRNQLDRQFVFGILVCGQYMRVFFCDRSGLLTTTEWIDLHDPEDTKTFVHVVLALSSIKVAKLGWDETMKLHRQSVSLPSRLQFEYSTDPCVRLADYGKSSYETQWAIFVPDEKGSQTGKWYVTVRALSLSQAEVMAGRATMVWMVKELNDDLRTVKEDSSGVIKVLKSAWNRAGSYFQTEKDLRGDVDLKHVVDIQISVPVGLETIQTTKTSSAIRGKIQGYVSTWKDGVGFSERAATGKRKIVPEPSGDLFDHRTALERSDGVASTLISRVLTRTVMRTYGWPIKFFKDRVELVTVLRDNVVGHRELYFKRMVAHRDASTGNVMISVVGRDVTNTQGVLIDLDHAKKADKRCTANMDKLGWDTFWIMMKSRYKSFNNADLALTLWQRCQGDIVQTLALVRWSASRANAFEPGRGIDDSKWDSVQEQLQLMLSFPLLGPNFDLQGHFSEDKNWPPSWVQSQHKSNLEGITGTPPFISFEVLTSPSQPYPTGSLNLRSDMIQFSPVHSAIHDLESLFWIFLYLCLTRVGPGGARRKEFDQSPVGRAPDDPVTKLHTAVWCLFENTSESLAKNKLRLFEHPHLLKDFLIPLMDEYFAPLHQLLIDWWDLLRWSYHTYDDLEQGLIHLKLISLLSKAVEELKESRVDELDMERNDAVKEMTETELERRRVDLERYWSFPAPYDPCSAPRVALEPVSNAASPKAARGGTHIAGASSTAAAQPESPTPRSGPARKRHCGMSDTLSGHRKGGEESDSMSVEGAVKQPVFK
ncbi:hypothetical protein BXZ70DRAFT_1027067 [Cristinia sonorae]|uniref:Fungal-type protein kinase domain-containing protein n=1 Tax=Cristinia sonorae TaxID=1940300 RepID=A0A8K0UMS0_9AGAR|nr:hypothetical protein BXZ70DRAFT_1027067 [Cristinia sonorae]